MKLENFWMRLPLVSMRTWLELLFDFTCITIINQCKTNKKTNNYLRLIVLVIISLERDLALDWTNGTY